MLDRAPGAGWSWMYVCMYISVSCIKMKIVCMHVSLVLILFMFKGIYKGHNKS